MYIFKSIFLALLLMPFFISTGVAQNNCTYTTYKWNVNLKKAVEFEQVSHAYSSLEKHEVDLTTNCTVCEEDQEWITIGDIPAFRMCKALAPNIRNILSTAYNDGFTFKRWLAIEWE